MSPDPNRRRRALPLGWLALAVLALLAAIYSCGDIKTPAFVQCTVSPDTLDFGGVTMGSSVDRPFTVTNGGSEAMETSIHPTCSDFTLVGGSSVSIPKGESHTFTLRFSPSATGTRPCRISIADCGVLTTRGQGLAGSSDCSVSPTDLSFGTVTVGSSEDRTFTVTNDGQTRLSGTVQESCAEFSLVGSASYDLAANEQATFTVRFAPTSGGIKSCTIDTRGLCADVSLTGTGQVPQADPVCSVSTSDLSFGTVAIGQTATRTFTITNTGGGTLSGSVSESCSSFSMVGSTTYSLGGGEAATFTVLFAPTSEGVKNCTIDIPGSCADVNVSGTGQIPPADPLCSVSTSDLSFGTVAVGQNATRTFTITNAGGGTLSGSVSETCSDFSIVGSATYALGAGQVATFTVRFEPQSAGDQSCTIATGSTCGAVTARGTGEVVAASCQLDSTTIDFHDVTVGLTADRKVTVTNSGLGTLTGTLSESCADLSIVGTASYNLGAVQSATFTLRFAPTSTGDFTCTVDAGSSCGNITVKGRGVPPPECEVADLDYDFGEVEIGKHKDHTIDIRNVGGGQLCGTASESCGSFEIVGGASYCAIPGTPFHMKLRFTPTSPGTFQCTVDPGAGCPAITLHGVGR